MASTRFGHGSLGRPKRGQFAVFRAGSSTLAVAEEQVWSSGHMLRSSSDAVSYSELLDDQHNSVNAADTGGNAGHAIVRPFAPMSYASWGKKFSIARETYELLINNNDNMRARCNLYVVRSKHPVQADPISFLSADTSSEKVYLNSAANYANHDPLIPNLGPLYAQYDLRMSTHFFKWFDIVECRKFVIKPGKSRIERFHLDNKTVEASWVYEAADNYNGAALHAPGEYWWMMDLTGELLPTVGNSLGPSLASVTLQYRHLIIYNRPRPFHERNYVTYDPESLVANSVYYKFIPTVKTITDDGTTAPVAAQARSKTKLGGWQ